VKIAERFGQNRRMGHSDRSVLFRQGHGKLLVCHEKQKKGLLLPHVLLETGF